MASTRKQTITAEDLYRMQLVTASEISPDGKHIVYSIQQVVQKTEKKFSNLWMQDTVGRELKQFTYGDHTDSHPAWSPDGCWIAFLSNRGDEKQPQIYLIPFGGGEARQLTRLNGEFGAFRWSPDSKRLVLQFRKKDADVVEREKNEDKHKLGEVDRRIQRVFYKLDGSGYLPNERWHIWTVDVRSGRPRQVTDNPVFDELDPAWSPDGRQIVYCSNRQPEPDFCPDAIDLFAWDVREKMERKIDTPPGFKTLPVFSPDGKSIAYIGKDGLSVEWKNQNLWVVPADGSDPGRCLTAAFDFDVSAFTLTDSGGPVLVAPVWSQDGKTIFFQVSRHGSTTLRSIDLEGKNLQTIVDGPGVVKQFSFDRNRETFSYLFGQARDPEQVFIRKPGSGRPKVLAALNQDWLKTVDLGEIEEVWFKGAGGNDLQGWILKPPGFDPSRKYPAILEIHGGPLAQYGNLFMHEFYFLAASGYVVIFCNPRGGQGYGEKHAKAIQYGRWGTVDYEDLMAWTDLIARKAYIDPERMGVTGGSYGGYMTNWIIGHTLRFKAAVTQRSVSNLISMWGSSDFNWNFQETFDNRAPYESIEVLWECSPMKHIGNARTPTLVLHNQQDLRCAIEQGEQVFVALKRLGVDTELIVFPDEPHGLSRTGRTDRRIARLKHIRRWFDRYLKG